MRRRLACSGRVPLVVACLAVWGPVCRVAAVTSRWTLQDANGNWNNPANWDNGVPKEPGDVALITNVVALTQARTITIDTPVSLKALKFGIPNSGGSGYTVQLGSGGSLTMNAGDGGHSVIQQLRGSARCKVTAATTLSNDVEIINSPGAATYFDVANPLSGTQTVLVNADGSSGQPYMTVASPAFLGNMTVCAGKLLFSVDCFGNTSEGTRVITLVSNAYLRLNGAFTPAANRQLFIGTGGGGFDGNGRILAFNASNQLAGAEAFTLRNQNSGLGGLHLGGANNAFTGTVLVDTLQVLRFGEEGSLSNSPLIRLLSATAALDVCAKAGGYTLPSSQVVAGVGVVSGLVNVVRGATLHPGIYTLPGPVTAPGVLSFRDGGLAITDGGVYAWEMAQLKDGTFSPGTTTYSAVNVADGDVRLDGGVLTLRFNGVAAPDSGNAFWQTEHVWPILNAASPPSGVLTVADGLYGDWAFTTRVTGNTLELVYGAYTPPRKGTLISVW